jgi:hypothetical protein
VCAGRGLAGSTVPTVAMDVDVDDAGWLVVTVVGAEGFRESVPLELQAPRSNVTTTADTRIARMRGSSSSRLDPSIWVLSGSWHTVAHLTAHT